MKAQEIHKRLYGGKLSHSKSLKLYEQYFNHLKKAAYLGNAEAQYDYAQQFEDMNFLSTNNPNHNPRRCVYWYGKACKNNHPAAYNNLAHNYELGQGCEKDLAKALRLYKQSADLGYSIARKNYNLCLKQPKFQKYLHAPSNGPRCTTIQK